MPHLFNCPSSRTRTASPQAAARGRSTRGHSRSSALHRRFRRKGVASAVIAYLEQDAANTATKAILETARTTEDSAALYTKLGYRVIPYYGSPAGAENCLCFEKNLGD
ncbi:MAG: GNAT family N-acetyltransferase [Butyricicoccus sp.]